jgi:hypothetical protein
MKSKSDMKTVDAPTQDRVGTASRTGQRRNRAAARDVRARSSWLCSAALLAIALVGCAVDDEPSVTEQAAPLVEASGPVAPAGFQIVWTCMGPTGRVGSPKTPLAACQAACPAGDTCIRCVWHSNALDCDL